MDHKLFQHAGMTTCHRCGYYGNFLVRNPTCNPVRILTDDDWKRFAEEDAADRRAWEIYHLQSKGYLVASSS